MLTGQIRQVELTSGAQPPGGHCAQSIPQPTLHIMHATMAINIFFIFNPRFATKNHRKHSGGWRFTTTAKNCGLYSIYSRPLQPGLVGEFFIAYLRCFAVDVKPHNNNTLLRYKLYNLFSINANHNKKSPEWAIFFNYIFVT